MSGNCMNFVLKLSLWRHMISRDKPPPNAPDLERLLGVSYLVHPLPMTAVVVLAFNDHYLKSHYPSFFTGKLSDFAGLFFFPLVLCALLNLAKTSLDRKLHWINKDQLLLSIIATDLIFIAVKFVPAVTALYLNFSSAIGFPSKVTPDATDLMAFSVNALTWKYAVNQIKKNGEPSESRKSAVIKEN